MEKRTKDLITELKENNQDHEWYPTTKDIVKVVSDDILSSEDNGYISILDIGSGNGNVFELLDKFIPKPKDQYDRVFSYTKYAIEKSKILIDAMPSDIFIIGTDFLQQTLIDKQVDVIFCNPPYSEFVKWTEKIINEANSKVVYMVIPERWKNSDLIQSTLEQRNVKHTIIGTSNFKESEYRKARSIVEIVRFQIKEDRYDKADPFDLWFDDTFKINADKQESSYSTGYENKQNKKEKMRELIKGQNLIERLSELYDKDMSKLFKNYSLLQDLDYEIFEELDIKIDNVKSSLKLKIEGLKNLYWDELFNNLNTLTDRLTKKSRANLLIKLTEHTSVDFSVSNAYAIVIWAVKNSNKYIDEQLLDVYLEMSNSKNVINYKSNKHFIEDNWRYCQKHVTHYKLDYRLVFERYSNFGEYNSKMESSSHNYINDIITIGKNLGFDVTSNSHDFEWYPGEGVAFLCKDGSKFMEIKAYKNGNIHCKPAKNFIKKLNIEAGRLNNWIKTPHEASEELNLSIEEVLQGYNKNFQIEKNNVLLLSD